MDTQLREPATDPLLTSDDLGLLASDERTRLDKIAPRSIRDDIQRLRNEEQQGLRRDGQSANTLVSDADMKQQQSVNATFDAELRTLARRQRNAVGLAAVVWIGPMVAFYALGWSIGWVIRGFRVQKTESKLVDKGT